MKYTRVLNTADEVRSFMAECDRKGHVVLRWPNFYNNLMQANTRNKKYEVVYKVSNRGQ